MNAEKFLRRFLPVFVLTFAADFIVSHLIDIIYFGDFYFNWIGPLKMGLTLGIVLAILNEKKEDNNK